MCVLFSLCFIFWFASYKAQAPVNPKAPSFVSLSFVSRSTRVWNSLESVWILLGPQRPASVIHWMSNFSVVQMDLNFHFRLFGEWLVRTFEQKKIKSLRLLVIFQTVSSHQKTHQEYGRDSRPKHYLDLISAKGPEFWCEGCETQLWLFNKRHWSCYLRRSLSDNTPAGGRRVMLQESECYRLEMAKC